MRPTLRAALLAPLAALGLMLAVLPDVARAEPDPRVIARGEALILVDFWRYRADRHWDRREARQDHRRDWRDDRRDRRDDRRDWRDEYRDDQRDWREGRRDDRRDWRDNRRDRRYDRHDDYRRYYPIFRFY